MADMSMANTYCPQCQRCIYAKQVGPTGKPENQGKWFYSCPKPPNGCDKFIGFIGANGEVLQSKYPPKGGAGRGGGGYPNKMNTQQHQQFANPPPITVNPAFQPAGPSPKTHVNDSTREMALQMVMERMKDVPTDLGSTLQAIRSDIGSLAALVHEVHFMVNKNLNEQDAAK